MIVGSLACPTLPRQFVLADEYNEQILADDLYINLSNADLSAMNRLYRERPRIVCIKFINCQTVRFRFAAPSLQNSWVRTQNYYQETERMRIATECIATTALQPRRMANRSRFFDGECRRRGAPADRLYCAGSSRGGLARLTRPRDDVGRRRPVQEATPTLLARPVAVLSEAKAAYPKESERPTPERAIWRPVA